MSTDSDRRPMGVEAEDLMARLVMANVDNLAATTDRIIENLTLDRDEARATIAAIRDRITALLSGDYQPTSRALERALRPSEATIRSYMKEETS